MKSCFVRCHLLIAFILAACVAARAITLASNGKSRYTISLPAKATVQEKKAALELQDFLRQSTGALLPIRHQVPTGPCIHIGGDYQGTATTPDSILIRTDRETIFLNGIGARGAYYSVLEFLERFLDIRFWTPAETHVPKMKNLVIPPTDYEYSPPFEVREMCCELLTGNPRFAARRRINGHWESIPKEYGGHEVILGFCHTFGKLLPPHKYFKDHPDWYALNGDRRAPNQLCLSNPMMREKLIQEVLQLLRKNPQAKVISVSQNDNRLYCTCQSCQHLDAQYGSLQSGILLDCINEVADAIKKDFPNTLVETLAYTYTVSPPKNIRPRDNVIVRQCSIHANIGAPLDSPCNESFSRYLPQWAKLSKQLAYWNYVTNFKNYMSPHPNIRHLAQDIRWMRKNRVSWVFEQGGSALEDLAEMRAYVISRLLWNPDLDDHELMRQFLHEYYGVAAPFIRDYIDCLHQELDHSGFKATCYIKSTSLWMRYPTLLKLRQLMTKAQKAVASDRLLSKRVLKAKLATNYSLLTRKESYAKNGLTHGELVNTFSEFSETVAPYSTSQYREGVPHSGLIPVLKCVLGLISPPRNLPAVLQEIAPAGTVFEITAEQFIKYKMFEKVWLQKDKLARTASKAAARMAANHSEWLIQYQPEAILTELKGPWDVYALVRAEGMAPADKTQDTPVAIAGIYNTQTGDHQQTRLSPWMLSNDTYSCIKVGTIDHPAEYFYLTPTNSEYLSAIWIDRILLVSPQNK